MAEMNATPERSGRRRASRKLPTRVDLTAMVDLAFLLITFFMLTTILSKPAAMHLTMPAGPAGPVPETRTMTLCLGKNNQVLWYLGLPQKPISGPKQTGYGKALDMVIAETQNQVFKSSGKGMIVIVKPTDHSNYANLVETLDDLNVLNVPGYSIAKISTEDIAFLKQHSIY